MAFDQSGPRWLGISDLIAEPEGPTFISYKVARSRLDRLRFVTRLTHSGSRTLGNEAREAVKALIVANHFLETELEKLRAAVSPGYARGKLLPRDRKDWYD